MSLEEVQAEGRYAERLGATGVGGAPGNDRLSVVAGGLGARGACPQHPLEQPGIFVRDSSLVLADADVYKPTVIKTMQR